MRIRQLALPCLAGAGLIIMAVPASSQGQNIVITGQKVPHGHEAISETVQIRDLKLATAAGQSELHKRVDRAVTHVCPMPNGKGRPHERQEVDACRKFAWHGAQPKIDSAIARAKAHHSG